MRCGLDFSSISSTGISLLREVLYRERIASLLGKLLSFVMPRSERHCLTAARASVASITVKGLSPSHWGLYWRSTR